MPTIGRALITGDAVQIALLATDLPLTHANFVVIPCHKKPIAYILLFFSEII